MVFGRFGFSHSPEGEIRHGSDAPPLGSCITRRLDSQPLCAHSYSLWWPGIDLNRPACVLAHALASFSHAKRSDFIPSELVTGGAAPLLAPPGRLSGWLLGAILGLGCVAYSVLHLTKHCRHRCTASGHSSPMPCPMSPPSVCASTTPAEVNSKRHPPHRMSCDICSITNRVVYDRRSGKGKCKSAVNVRCAGACA